jgi:hypothetical protein
MRRSNRGPVGRVSELAIDRAFDAANCLFTNAGGVTNAIGGVWADAITKLGERALRWGSATARTHNRQRVSA